MTNGAKAVIGIGILAAAAIALQFATGSTRLNQVEQLTTTLRKVAVFEGYLWFVVLYSVATPLLPWVFARGQGWRRVWGSAGAGLFVLLLLHASLKPLCSTTSCGERAFLIVGMWMFVAPISLFVTALSATAAAPPAREPL